MNARVSEFDLIARIRARAATRGDVRLGIGDDAAIVAMPPDRLLAIAMDTLNVGVHFPDGTAAADIGWKALAVNLSDLAAMGAEPAWCTLSLSLPNADAVWLDGFLDGFFELASQHRVALIGGDTTRGPLSVCATVHGFVSPQGVLRRDAARVGDDVWVTGSLGDAAAALHEWREGGARNDALRERLDRPTPRVVAGRALAGLAHACIDVSDGLLADLGHVCRSSRVGAEIALADLPLSTALSVAHAPTLTQQWQTAGGDDYELCFTAPPTARLAIEDAMLACDTSATCIGRIVATPGEVVVRDADGEVWMPTEQGYAHFVE